MKKGILIVLLSFMLVFAAFASGSTEAKQTTITVAVQSTPTMDYLVSIIPEFEAATGIKVIADLMPYDNLVEKVTIDCTSNTKQYAAFWMEPTWLGRFENELEDITKYINDPVLGKDFHLEDFSADFLNQTVRYNGKLLGLPFEGCLLVMAYRVDLFEKYNIAVPKTYDELLAAAKLIGEKEKDVYGITMMGKRGQPVFYEYMPYMYGFGAEFFDSNMNPTLNTPEGVAALEYMISLAKYAPAGVTSFGWEEAATAFMQGNAAAGVLFTDWLPSLKSPDECKVYDKWNFAVVPAGPKGQGSPVGTVNLGVNADCDEETKKAAFQFINWATSSAMQKRLAVIGATPTRNSVLTDPEFKTADYKYFQGISDTFAITRNPMSIPEFFELNEALSIELSAAIAGDKTAQKALDDAQAAWVKIMKEAGYIK